MDLMSTDTQDAPAAAGAMRAALPQRVHGYRVATISLLVLTGLWRLVSISQWSWQADDWLFIERTRTMGFGEYLFQIHNGHLQPGQFLVFWEITQWAPLSVPLAAGATWLLSMASLIVWALLFRSLLGERWAAVIGLVPVALAPGFVPIVVWAAAGITVYALQLFLGLTLLSSLRWSRSGARSGLWLTAASFAVGLLFWEKSLLAVIPVLGLSLMLARRPSGELIRRRVLALAAVLAAISAAYVVVYATLLAHSGTQSTTWVLRGVGDLTRFYWSAITQNLLPALTGGPVPSQAQSGSGLLIPTSAAQWVVTGGALLLTVWGLGRRRRGWIPVATAGVYVAVSMGLVVMSSRYDSVGLLSALDPRYAADSIVVVALFGTLLLVPAVGEPDPLQPREGGPLRLPRWLGPSIAGVLVALALATSAAVWDGISPTSPKPWVDRFLPAVTAAGNRPIVDGVPPGNVLNAYLAGPAARLSAMVSVLDLPVAWDGVGPDLSMFDAAAALRPAAVAPQVHAYPVPGCGYRISPGASVSLPLDNRVFAWQWGVEMAYQAGDTGPVRVTADRTPIELPVTNGKGQVKGVLNDGITRPLTLTNLGAHEVCVAWIAVGQLSPVPAS
jgi:hypothetical protein